MISGGVFNFVGLSRVKSGYRLFIVDGVLVRFCSSLFCLFDLLVEMIRKRL